MVAGDIFVAAFVQLVLEKLALVAARQLTKGGKSRKTVCIQEWETMLRMIEALLSDAEHKQCESKAIKGWLENVQDLAYDLEDFLDDFAAQTQQLNKDIGRLGSISKKVCTSTTNPIRGMGEVILAHKIYSDFSVFIVKLHLFCTVCKASAKINL